MTNTTFNNKSVIENNKNRVQFLIFFVIFIYLIICAIQPVTTDFMHLYNSGKEIVETKNLIYYNNDFVLSGYKVVIQQWLYDIFLYLFAQIGYIGTVIFIFIQEVFLFYSYYKLCRELKCSEIESLVVCLFGLLMFYSYLNLRPQMITIILLTWSIIFIERSNNTNNTKWLYLLPLLTWVEVNVHSTCVLFHIAILLPYMVPFIRKFNVKIKQSNLFIVTLLDIIFMFINPYGIKAITCVFATYNDLTWVGELRTHHILLYSLIFLMSIIGLYKFKCLTNVNLYLSMGMFIVFFKSYRNVMFLSLAMVYSYAMIFYNAKIESMICLILNKLMYNVILVLCSILLLINFCMSYDYFENNSNIVDSLMDVNIGCSKPAIDYIKQNEADFKDVKVLTDFDIGAYFIYNDIHKIYMQGKAEVYAKGVNEVENVLVEYRNIFFGRVEKEEFENFLNKYNFDYVCLEYDYSFIRYLQESEEWVLILNNDFCQLYKRIK